MEQELQVIAKSELGNQELGYININVDKLINENINKEEFVSQLAFLCTGILACGDEFETKVSPNLRTSMLWGEIYGTNRALGDKLVMNKSAAQYVAQLILQKLAEQKLMSFDLITAINNRLNASVSKIDTEFDNIYKGMTTFLKKNRNELAKLEARMEKAERNIQLLTWQTSIEYQDFDGVEYCDLDEEAQIVCLVRDFYEITKGKWTTSDLLVLKSALADIKMHYKSKVNFFEAIQAIASQDALKQKLLGGKVIKKIKDPSMMLSMTGLAKLDSFAKEDHYLVESFSELLGEHGVDMDDAEIMHQLSLKYFRKDVLVNMDIEIDVYDLCLDLLYNLKLAEKMGILVDPSQLLDQGVESANKKELMKLQTELSAAQSEIAYYKNASEQFKEELSKYTGSASGCDIANASIGDIVKFGRYYRSNSNEKEDIEWQVLDVENDRVLLISKYGLDCIECGRVKNWLDDRFVKMAFSDAEIEKILIAKTPQKSVDHAVAVGGLFACVVGGQLSAVKVVDDLYNKKLFLLSEDEVQTYFTNKQARKCVATNFAVKNGVSTPTNRYCSWFLRDKSKNDHKGLRCVSSDGDILNSYRDYNDSAVRPAMWVNKN